MNTHEGYSKKTLTNADVLLAGGGDKSLTDFLGSIQISASKIQYKTAADNATWQDLITLVNTDENVKQIPKTDNVNRPLMMINGGISAGELTNTSMFSTGIYANASTKMITANGFVKGDSSNSYFLLGGGGHTLTTNYSLSTHNHDSIYIKRNNDTIPGYVHSSFANNEEKGFWLTLANQTFSLRFTFGSSSHNGGLYSPELGWWCYLPNGATSNAHAIFTGKASYAGDADTLDSYHANTLFESLIRPSNTNDISIKIGNSTKSITLGSRAWDSTSYLPLAGGDMTGCIRRTYSSASDDPMISLASLDLDVWLWRISDSYHLTSARYGYGLKYLGTGFGLSNALGLYVDNGTGTLERAVYMDNAGYISFLRTPTVGSTAVSLSNHNHVGTYVENVSINDTLLRITKNGNIDLTIPYATSAGNASTADLANMIKNNITVSSSSGDNGIKFNNGTRNIFFGNGSSGNSGIYTATEGWLMGISSSGSIFLNGNATSATSASKLSTPRTIWGQSFDGSANISGDMSGVGTINTIFKVDNSSGSWAKLNIVDYDPGIACSHMYVSSNTGSYPTSRPLTMQVGYGNVGIGTYSPAYKLEVSGSGNFTSLYVGGTAVSLEGHKHAYNTLTGSGTTANQAILSNGTANGWKLTTLGARAFDDTAYLPLTGGTLTNGSTSDGYILKINSGGGMSGLQFLRGGNTSWSIYVTGGNFYIHETYSNTIAMRWYESSLGFACYHYGNVYAPNFYTTSDRSKKQNISSFSEHIRKFQLKDTEKWHYGVIALEVPEMFRDGEEGNMTVNYNSVLSYYVGLLENRVKELEDEINKLKNK